ncbi:MAG TPA: alpha-2-macroglobulin family protein, partial [Gemmatimonadaceae bacterium]
FTRFGTSADSFDLAPNAPLGHYQVELQRHIDAQWLAVSHTSFRTLEYRAPEFAITLAGDSLAHFIGDTLTWRVSGRYLYDAPMRGAVVRWGATLNDASPWDLQIPALPHGFGFGDPAATWEGRPRSAPNDSYSGTDTLDGNGQVEIRMADTSRAVGTRQVTFSVAVEDVNRQVVTSSEDATLFGSSHYLALRVLGRGWWWRIGDPVRVEVLAVRPDGSRAVGESITARLVHSRWIDSSGVGASGRWMADTVATWSLASADTAISLSFTPRGGGYYTLQLLSRDRQGRPVESRIRRYVLGGGFRLPVEGPATRLAIEADSLSHAVGATAAIRFESPFESADAWVTVEREGLLRQFRRPVRRGPNEIGIAVGEEMAPTSLVGVVLLNRAPTGSDDDSLHRRLRTGMVQVRVDSLVKRLAVTVAPEQRDVAPGAETRLTLQVSDYRGRGTAAAVTIWAVDEGVLSMGWYTRPDPATVLQAHWMRWLALASTLPSSIPLMRYRRPVIDSSSTDNTRQELRARQLAFSANRLALSEVVVTGTGAEPDAMAKRGAGHSDVRQDFRTTAFFSAVALTNGEGRATVTVRLPDNVTSYRLFAVAVGADDRAGSAESTFVATRPLVVRAALPRFVRPGDSFFAGAAIGTRDGQPRDVRVETEATGIALNGLPNATLRLGANAGVAKFDWSARESDSARITIAATDGTDSDAVRVALPVKPDRFPLARSISGVIRDTLTVRLALPGDIDLTRSRLTIRAGTTPLTLLDEARQYLVLYPYMCTEQLLASARVAVASLTLQRAGHPVAIDRNRTIRLLQSVIDQLTKRQRADGAFGYWSSDSWSTPWLSTAVGLLLLDATNAGVAVDTQLTSRLTQYLTKTLDSLPFFPDTSAGTRIERRQTAERHLGERLAATTYLRRIGQPREAEERALLDRAALLAWEDRVLLAQLLHQAGKVVEARNLLERAWSGLGSAGLRVEFPDSIMGRGLFRSRVRPAARLVEATIAIDPSHPRLGALMERLISRTSAASRYWWNTQDYASGASAVAAFTRLVPRGQATLSANVLSAQQRGSANVVLRTIDGAAVDSTTSLIGLGAERGDSLILTIRFVARNGPIFYGITSHEVSAVPDTRPLVNGVTVERWYERFDNGEPATEVREGELVRVRLRVTVPSQREFLAVEDHLPAGLEAVDLSLRTSGTLGPFSAQASVEARARRDREAAAGMAIGSWDSGWWSPWEHSEKRDDRVVWFARSLSSGSYVATYVARATTSGRFIRPPARAEEMYNAATSGRSEGGIFVVTGRR